MALDVWCVRPGEASVTPPMHVAVVLECVLPVSVLTGGGVGGRKVCISRVHSAGVHLRVVD